MGAITCEQVCVFIAGRKSVLQSKVLISPSPDNTCVGGEVGVEVEVEDVLDEVSGNSKSKYQMMCMM